MNFEEFLKPGHLYMLKPSIDGWVEPFKEGDIILCLEKPDRYFHHYKWKIFSVVNHKNHIQDFYFHSDKISKGTNFFFEELT